jgi:hypothetical protein
MICENPKRTILFALLSGSLVGAGGILFSVTQPAIITISASFAAISFETANHLGYVDKVIEDYT